MEGLTMVLGLVAGVLTTMSMVPQIIRTHRTKHTRDLSLWMFCLLAAGVAMWAVYGVLIDELPIVLANGVSFALAVYIIVMKLRHG